MPTAWALFVLEDEMVNIVLCLSALGCPQHDGSGLPWSGGLVWVCRCSGGGLVMVLLVSVSAMTAWLGRRCAGDGPVVLLGLSML